MTPPVLCIIQARYASTRLPAKMLLKLGDETLIQRAWRLAGEAFGAENCVIAIPKAQPAVFTDHLGAIGATVFVGWSAESDVLNRFFQCAHTYRWRPETVVHRWTPDDPFKSPETCRRVVAGERLPVEIGGEAFTLATLGDACRRVTQGYTVEHLTDWLFTYAPPPAPSDDVWTVDTQADYERAVARYEREAKAQTFYCTLTGTPYTPEMHRRSLAALRAIQESA